MNVTGVTTTRLSEIKKYRKSGVFYENYVIYNPETGTGWVEGSIDDGEVIYYVKRIKYRDVYDENGEIIITFFEFTPIELDATNNKCIKINNYGKSVDLPIINEDVFIERGQTSPFKNNYLLRDMSNMIDVGTFVGGNYFKIYKN